MEHDELREPVRRVMDECFRYADARPSQKDIILNRIQGGHTVKRRIPMTLAFAALLMLAMCGGVVAAGLGVFGQLSDGENAAWNGERLIHLDDAAHAVGQTAETDVFALTIDQAYCDGGKVYFSYTLCAKEDGRIESLSLGDGADLEDGAGMTIWDRGDELVDGRTIQGYQEVEVPEGTEIGETLAIVLTVIDQTKEGKERFMRVPFTVPVEASQRRSGRGTFAEYSAQAEMTVSAAEVYGIVTLTAPESWSQRWVSAQGEDINSVCDYVLIADGVELTSKDANIDGISETGYSLRLRYDLPESCVQMTLRPVRYLGGETAQEDIALE